MPEMIGAELRLETIFGQRPGRDRHHAGIGDDQIELFARRIELVGGGACAFQRRQIEFDQFDACNRRRRAPRLFQIARRAHDGRAMRRQRPRGLDAEPGRYAGHQHALAGEIDAFEHLVRGGFRAKNLGVLFCGCLGHGSLLGSWERGMSAARLA